MCFFTMQAVNRDCLQQLKLLSRFGLWHQLKWRCTNGARRLLYGHVNDVKCHRLLLSSPVQWKKQIERARITGLWPFLGAECGGEMDDDALTVPKTCEQDLSAEIMAAFARL